MTDDITFEHLAEDYGLGDANDGLQESNLSSSHSDHRPDGLVTSAYPTRMQWRPSTPSAHLFDPRLSMTDVYDSLASNYRYDSVSSDVVCLPAAPPPLATLSQSLNTHMSIPGGVRDHIAGPEGRSLSAAIPSQLQRQDEMFAEPEPGHRVRLVPVSTLRE